MLPPLLKRFWQRLHFEDEVHGAVALSQRVYVAGEVTSHVGKDAKMLWQESDHFFEDLRLVSAIHLIERIKTHKLVVAKMRKLRRCFCRVLPKEEGSLELRGSINRGFEETIDSRAVDGGGEAFARAVEESRDDVFEQLRDSKDLLHGCGHVGRRRVIFRMKDFERKCCGRM